MTPALPIRISRHLSGPALRHACTALGCILFGPIFVPEEWSFAYIPWFIYLTNWGFLPVFVYFTGHTVRRLLAIYKDELLPTPANAHPHASFEFCFHLMLTLQPFVVLGFWTLVFPVVRAV